MTLWAKAVNPLTGKPLVGLVLEFLNDTGLVGESETGSDGEVSTSWWYRDDGLAHWVKVRVREDMAVGYRTMATQPVTLKVSRDTSLLLSVEREHSSTNHTIGITISEVWLSEKIP